MEHLDKLISVIRETRKYLARPGNDYSWSSWEDSEHALAEIDSILTRLESGSVPDIEILFAPTGPIQEVSTSSGWSREYIELARRFDDAYAIAGNRS